MTITLIGNGSYVNCGAALEQSDFVVAVDGGANHCLRLGVVPDVVIGDGDSIRNDVRPLLDTAEFINTPDQDFSDLQKAVQYVADKGASHIDLYSFTSNERMDHTLAAFTLLRDFAHLPLRLHGPTWTARYVHGTQSFPGLKGQTVSLLPLGLARGIETTGLQWPVTDEILAQRSVSVSNIVTDDVCTLSVAEGGLLFINNHSL